MVAADVPEDEPAAAVDVVLVVDDVVLVEVVLVEVAVVDVGAVVVEAASATAAAANASAASLSTCIAPRGRLERANVRALAVRRSPSPRSSGLRFAAQSAPPPLSASACGPKSQKRVVRPAVPLPAAAPL